jgi:hypothetical protein
MTDLRQWCLLLSLQYATADMTMVDVVAHAEMFYMFIAKPTVH